MSANCDITLIFPVYGQFGAIWNLDSERTVCSTYIFINSNLSSYKNKNRTKKIQTQLSYYCFE